MTQRELLGATSKKHEIGGYAGSLIDKCIHNGVMATNFHPFVQAFHDKTDTEGLFCGEFWGKWFTSAVLACEYEPTEEHFAILKEAVYGLMAAQEADGRLSASGIDFSHWDIWGRKYVLLGLLAYYDISKDEKVLNCAIGAADNLISVTAGENGRKVTETGLMALQGLSSCSILQPVVFLYERTGEKRFLDYAEYLVGLWGVPSAYTKDGLRLIEQSVPGCTPVTIAAPKAYEIMSCYEGLLELYHATGRTEYFEAVKSYMEAVLKREIMITGSGSSGELWCEGAYRQTQLLEAPMETCVTATFMKMCRELLCLTGDVKWANQLEISLFNALAGALLPEGNWWAYFSPLLGERVPSQVQIEYVHSSCCVVNGPRALLEVPKWCVMNREDGIAVNLYQKGTYRAMFGGQEVELEQDTEYPKSGRIVLTFKKAADGEMTLALRIPEWAQGAQIRVGEERIAARPGTYCELKREWKSGDRAELNFDMRVRIVKAPGNEVFKALMSGPVVLGLDQRFVKEEPKSLWLMNDAMKWVDDKQMNLSYCLTQSLAQETDRPIAEPCESEGALLAYRVKFLNRPIHFFDHKIEEIVFRDYASCGSSFAENTAIRVWFPDPMFCGDIFPRRSRGIVAAKKEDEAYSLAETGNR